AVRLLRTGERDAPRAHRSSGRGAGVRPVGAHPLRTLARPTRPVTLHGGLLSNGTSCGLSPAWPGVRITLIGSPRPSVARWILVVSPPRERPSASPARARSLTHPV